MKKKLEKNDKICYLIRILLIESKSGRETKFHFEALQQTST